jgi:hypothetical protein
VPLNDIRPLIDADACTALTEGRCSTTSRGNPRDAPRRSSHAGVASQVSTDCRLDQSPYENSAGIEPIARFWEFTVLVGSADRINFNA